MGDLSSIIGELERMYGKAVRQWFRDPDNWTDEARHALASPPIISVASRGRKRTVGGWYTAAVWFDSTDDLLAALAGTSATVAEPVKRAEIVVASEVLGDPVQTVAEMVRQMVQHAVPNLRVGENYYYSQEWTTLARRFGCDAEIDSTQPSKGWSKLVPSSDFVTWCNATLKSAVFDVERDQSTTAAPVGSRMKKWTCGCTVVRSAVALAAVCARCHHAFWWAEKNEQMPPEHRVSIANDTVIDVGAPKSSRYSVRPKRNTD